MKFKVNSNFIKIYNNIVDLNSSKYNGHDTVVLAIFEKLPRS
jgi:hypothetical protein